jgi:hypothetical protein
MVTPRRIRFARIEEEERNTRKFLVGKKDGMILL